MQPGRRGAVRNGGEGMRKERGREARRKEGRTDGRTIPKN